MLRIAHLSDIHAGYQASRKVDKQGINARESDGYRVLRAIVSDVIERQVDLVVVAGDIFHLPFPTPRTIVFVQNELRRLNKAGIPVYMLAGNHETTDVVADVASSRILHDPDRDIHSHIEPYVVHEVAPDVYLHMISHHMYSQQSETMSKVSPVEGAVNILTTHGSVIDPILQIKLHNNQSPREIVIPDSVIGQDWSYTMLGHIHERGFVGSQDGVSDTEGLNIYYNGSSIRRGFSDAEGKMGRGWTLWMLHDDGTFTFELRNVAQRPQYDFVLDASGMSASEITDRVIDNLKTTQLNGREFNIASAPILRQTIMNVATSTLSGLNHNAINLEAGHGLSWQLRSKKVASVPTKQEQAVDENSGDLITAYDKWAKSAEVVNELDNTVREKVVKQAKEFIELGQEEVLELE